jgi:DNA-binding beta-propeller fold protein YncE
MGAGWVVLAGCSGAAPGAPEAPVGRASAGGPRAVGATACRPRERAPGDPRPLDASGVGGPLQLAVWQDSTVAIVADEDERTVHVVDVSARRGLSRLSLAGRPSGLVLLADGRIAVALRDRSELVVIEPGASPADPLRLGCSVPTPAEPVGLTLAGDAKLLVTAGYGAALAVFDASSLSRQALVALPREPRGVVASDDGRSAFVTHAVGGRLSVVDLETGTARQISLAGRTHQQLEAAHDALGEVGGAAGATAADRKAHIARALDRVRQDTDRNRFERAHAACQAFAIAKTSSSGRIFVPQVLVDTGDFEQRTAGYGEEQTQTELPAVAVVDAASAQPLWASLVPDAHLRFMGAGIGLANERPEHCLLPRAAAVDAASRTLYVACHGIDTVIAYDALAATPVSSEKRRWRVGAGPTGLAVDAAGGRLVVWSQFDRSLHFVPLGGPELEIAPGDDQAQVRALVLEPTPGRELGVEIALGRALFHASGDNRIAADGRACASCHPDGRDDALVWATPNGPRRTKLLAGMLAGTAPYGWDGAAGTVREHLEETFKRLNGAGGLRSLELRALLAYLDALPTPVRPASDPRDPKIRRGAELFASEETGCAGCHDGASRTDRRMHDVGSRHKADRAGAFDTPALRFLGGRAPFFHDGRYATLRDLLIGSDGKMGHTRHLSPEDIDALEAYLASL